MLGVRPLLRAAASEFCGYNAHQFQQMARRRLASTWLQDVTDSTKEGESHRLTGRIHILGLGNVGTFVAHSLASRPSPPPITLLLHTPDWYSAFRKKKHCVAIQSKGLSDVKNGFDVNVLYGGTWRSIPFDRGYNDAPAAEEHAIPEETVEEGVESIDAPGYSAMEENVPEDNEEIDCLIVSVKAPVTASALQTVRHRLTPKSTILFLQNGMGVIDEINQKIFPDPDLRPNYIVGIISHGLLQYSQFNVHHTGLGTTILGPVLPQSSVASGSGDKELDWAPSTKYLMRTLTLTPSLVAVAEPPSSVMLYQLEKLAMNCVINPLTALMGCRNGELLYNYSFTRIMRLLLMEISSVICSMPELQSIPGIESRFSPERLRWMVTQLANKTEKNYSSMLQDLRANKTTEIEFLNGYIVRKGEELGIKCVVNYMVKHLVLAKQQQFRQRDSSYIPIDIRSDTGDKPS
ncbi:ketopantoate reductase PanE/ApbA C terminal-domain-containing protein [Aspergillus karnatakaensis]|uniref:ketopantoate reductase family protein n=1 Tax=Aspergillus karnatakaensis TaxID=1810916 RepID=UPI003CCCCAC9